MFEELKTAICNYVDVNPEDIKPESRFIEDLGFTSYDFMSLLGEVEENYGITVDENEVLNLITVKDAVDYLEGLKG